MSVWVEMIFMCEMTDNVDWWYDLSITNSLIVMQQLTETIKV